MTSKANLNKAIIKSDYSRHYPDPLNENSNGTPLNIVHHVLLCKAVDIPSGISKTPNPREQKIDHGIYKEVMESLENADDLSFHLKNKGITILAHQVEYSSADKKTAAIYFAESDGIADGGHTYEIILSAQAKGSCPDGQYVKLEVITGVPADMAVDITGGLNTAVQVDDTSLLNLEGEFNWVKEALKNTNYADQISYKQNQDGKIDIREILGLMTLFHVNKFTGTQHPMMAYVSKAKCVDLFKSDKDSFQMLTPLLKDILYLHDYVHVRSKELYNADKRGKGERGKAGAMKGVYATKKRGNYDFIFMGEAKPYKLYDGALYPMLGAMRFLVEQKPGKDFYSWKLKSFEDVKTFFDEIAPDLVATTYNTSLTYGRKPNPIGKDENHWDNLYKTTALHFYSKYASI